MQKWTDQYVEELIGNLLQTGVIVASAVVLLGGSIYLVRHGLSAPQYQPARIALDRLGGPPK